MYEEHRVFRWFAAREVRHFHAGTHINNIQFKIWWTTNSPGICSDATNIDKHKTIPETEKWIWTDLDVDYPCINKWNQKWMLFWQLSLKAVPSDVCVQICQT